MADWTLQDAKNKFSAVVEAAMGGVPQRVTRRGKPAVVVLSATQYERLHLMQKLELPGFADLLLSMPTDDGCFERLPETPRAPDF